MFERLIERARLIAERRARARVLILTDAMAADLPRDVAAEASEAGVVLRGRGLAARMALDPALRWLTAALRGVR